jgi:hypothetical protein
MVLPKLDLPSCPPIFPSGATDFNLRSSISNLQSFDVFSRLLMRAPKITIRTVPLQHHESGLLGEEYDGLYSYRRRGVRMLPFRRYVCVFRFHCRFVAVAREIEISNERWLIWH